jgi:uncharacterized protein (DUF427 family)
MSTSLSTPQNTFAPPAVEPRIELSPRWIRVKFGDAIIADSKRALLLREYGPGLPAYYFPRADVRVDVPATHVLAADACDARGFHHWTVRVGNRVAENAAWVVVHPSAEIAALRDHVSFTWGRMDAWYEEEEEVFVHARDPYARVDVLPSSRHVRIVIDGQIVAETLRPWLLFETGLPTRYYIPPDDIRMDLLDATSLTTRCPYKGIARYWSAKHAGKAGSNIVWSYPDPIAECPKIRGLLSFFNERVDLYLDGEIQPRPLTPWSR